MRRFLLIASAAAIALVGLSANQCGGSDDKAADTPPAETPAPASPPAESTPPAESAPPAETPPPAEPPAQQ